MLRLSDKQKKNIDFGNIWLNKFINSEDQFVKDINKSKPLRFCLVTVYNTLVELGKLPKWKHGILKDEYMQDAIGRANEWCPGVADTKLEELVKIVLIIATLADDKLSIVTPNEILNELKRHPLLLTNEKAVQKQIHKILSDRWKEYHDVTREVELNDANIIDIVIGDIGIEVKLSGNPQDIFYQCERYCEFPEIKFLILATNKAMNLPPIIKGKPTYVYNLSNNLL